MKQFSLHLCVSYWHCIEDIATVGKIHKSRVIATYKTFLCAVHIQQNDCVGFIVIGVLKIKKKQVNAWTTKNCTGRRPSACKSHKFTVFSTPTYFAVSLGFSLKNRIKLLWWMIMLNTTVVLYRGTSGKLRVHVPHSECIAVLCIRSATRNLYWRNEWRHKLVYRATVGV